VEGIKKGGKNTAFVIILTISYEKPKSKIRRDLSSASLFP
jgi:hypothetical protein